MLLVAATGAMVHHFNSSVSTMPLPHGVDRDTDGSGRNSDENILVIGSDARDNAEDCRLGGDCDAGPLPSTGNLASTPANADVEMVVHLSADQRWLTVLSIPRDTEITVPRCNGPRGDEEPHIDRINSTLQYGPQCTITAVHQLTGLAIEHFVMVDFSDMVKLSDAIGGVNVCVTDNVYDTYSHLKLTRGTHTLQGQAALEFVRSRHAFGDGSDIGRTVAQHIFLSALQHKIDSAGTLLNPASDYRLLEAATKAMTVDTGLGSVTALTRLGATLSGVPADHTTYVTMPTVPDPSNKATVLPAPTATSLFERIATDHTNPTTNSRLHSNPTTLDRSPSMRTSHTPSPMSVTASPVGDPTTVTTPSAAAFPSVGSSANDYQQTDATDPGCAKVSPYQTVDINGVTMTPAEAFDKSPHIALSAP